MRFAVALLLVGCVYPAEKAHRIRVGGGIAAGVGLATVIGSVTVEEIRGTSYSPPIIAGALVALVGIIVAAGTQDEHPPRDPTFCIRLPQRQQRCEPTLEACRRMRRELLANAPDLRPSPCEKITPW